MAAPADKHFVPPWEFLPREEPSSIAWRMGPGDNYRFEWNRFYESLSEDEQAAYRERYPEPEAWRGFYAGD